MNPLHIIARALVPEGRNPDRIVATSIGRVPQWRLEEARAVRVLEALERAGALRRRRLMPDAPPSAPSAAVEAVARAMVAAAEQKLSDVLADFSYVMPSDGMERVLRAALHTLTPTDHAAAVQRVWEEGYDAGFERSAEGWNGEYGASTEDAYYAERKFNAWEARAATPEGAGREEG